MDNEILYAPCPCGSKKKFKFCCLSKVKDQEEKDFQEDLKVGREKIKELEKEGRLA
jgi:hypothetical protein